MMDKCKYLPLAFSFLSIGRTLTMTFTVSVPPLAPPAGGYGLDILLIYYFVNEVINKF